MASLACPACEQVADKVIDSRPTRAGHAIRRRRECEGCGTRFTTFEQVVGVTIARPELVPNPGASRKKTLDHCPECGSDHIETEKDGTVVCWRCEWFRPPRNKN